MTDARVVARHAADAPSLVAVDWGTTHLRGYVVRAGRVTREAVGTAGAGSLEPAAFAPALVDLLGRLGARSGPVLVAGMASSAEGWMEVPWVTLPAGAAELGRATTRLPDHLAGPRLRAFDVCLVPGVSDVRAGGLHDFMRGEETEFLGCGAGDGVVVLPGSHSKWVVGRGSRIVALMTYLTGESYTALGRHTLLRRSTSDDLGFSDEQAHAFARGVAASDGDLLRELFTVRVRALGGADRPSCSALLSGLLIGTEVRAGLRWSGSPATVTVGGTAHLQRLYGRAIRQVGAEVRPAPPTAIVDGICAVAASRGHG